MPLEAISLLQGWGSVPELPVVDFDSGRYSGNCASQVGRFQVVAMEIHSEMQHQFGLQSAVNVVFKVEGCSVLIEMRSQKTAANWLRQAELGANCRD